MSSASYFSSSPPLLLSSASSTILLTPCMRPPDAIRDALPEQEREKNIPEIVKRMKESGKI